MVYDVTVAEECRNEGLGRRLLGTIADHPALVDTNEFFAAVPRGAAPFYESCGFEVDDGSVEHPDGSPEFLRWTRYRRD